jgi:hypothetical protein
VAGIVVSILKLREMPHNDYNRRYDEIVSRFEATKAERDTFTAEIR